MAQVKPIHKIRATAYYFVYVSRNLKRIARDFGVSERTITRYAADPIWTQVLDDCDYLGDRSFEVQPLRDVARDAGDALENARKEYQKAIKAGVPQHKIAALVERETGIRRQRIRVWSRRYGWREG